MSSVAGLLSASQTISPMIITAGVIISPKIVTAGDIISPKIITAGVNVQYVTCVKILNFYKYVKASYCLCYIDKIITNLLDSILPKLS